MRVKGKSKDPKRTEADKKRVQSMIEMKKGYKLQKDFIQSALSSVDIKPKNKIVFNSDDDEDVTSKTNGESNENGTNHKSTLFSDDDDSNVEESYNFEVKEQFEGKKGRKLLELQSKYKKDDRFQLDERFLDDDQEDDQTETTEEGEEHKKQLEILQEVLGTRIASTSGHTDKESHKAKSMLRFDPSQPEHTKFEIKEAPKEKKKKKRKTGMEADSSNVEPEVSKEKFYEVSEGLKDVFKEKQEFSLLSMFSQQLESIPAATENDEATAEENSNKDKTKSYGANKNPFRYDSSTDDDEEQPIKNTKENNESKTETTVSNLAPSRLWTESFFFKPDDYRLQEGLDFVKKMELEELSEFAKLRRDLKHIVKTKVKNNQRKNKPFKKKLGGRKKMIKIKKAIKR